MFLSIGACKRNTLNMVKTILSLISRLLKSVILSVFSGLKPFRIGWFQVKVSSVFVQVVFHCSRSKRKKAQTVVAAFRMAEWNGKWKATNFRDTLLSATTHLI